MFSIKKYSDTVPFHHIETDKEVGAIFLIIQLKLPGRTAYVRYCITAPHQMYKSGDFDDMISVISTTSNKNCHVVYQMKQNALTKRYYISNFNVDLDELADSLRDDRFKQAEVAYTEITYTDEKES